MDMFVFFKLCLANLACYDSLDTAILSVSLHSDAEVLKDIKSYLDSTTGHIYSPRDAAEFYFGTVFDKINNTLKKFDIQILADYQDLFVDVKGCYDGVAQDTGSDLLNEITRTIDLQGIHILLVKCQIEESAILLSGKCGRLIVLTHTFVTDLEKRVTEQILRTLGSSPRLRIDKPLFDDKFIRNVCSYLDTCVSTTSSDVSRLLEGSIEISNMPTSRSKIEDIKEALLEDFDNDLDALVGRELYANKISAKNITPISRLDYMDLQIITDGNTPINKPVTLKIAPSSSPTRLNQVLGKTIGVGRSFQGRYQRKVTHSPIQFFKSSKLIPSRKRAPLEGGGVTNAARNADESPFISKNEAQIPDFSKNKKLGRKDKLEDPIDVMKTSPLFKKGKPSRSLMPEDLLIPDYLEQLQDDHKNDGAHQSGGKHLNSDPYSVETPVNRHKQPDNSSGPSKDGTSTRPNRKSLNTLPPDNPLDTTNDLIKSSNRAHRSKIEPIEPLIDPHTEESDLLADETGAFVTKNNEGLPPGHYAGDSDEIMESVHTGDAHSSLSCVNHNSKHIIPQNLSFVSADEDHASLLGDVFPGQSFNTVEERKIYIKTRTSPDFNPKLKKHRNALLLSEMYDPETGLLDGSKKRITWSRGGTKESTGLYSKVRNSRQNRKYLSRSSSRSSSKSSRSSSKWSSSSSSTGRKSRSSVHSGSLGSGKGLGSSLKSNLTQNSLSKSKFSGNLGTAVTDLQTAKNNVDDSIKNLRRTAMGNDPAALSESITALADSNAALKNTLGEIENKARSTSSADVLKNDIKGILKNKSDYGSLTSDIRKRIDKKDSLDSLKDNMDSLYSQNEELQEKIDDFAEKTEDINIKDDLEALREKDREIDDKIGGILENDPSKEQTKRELSEMASKGEEIKSRADELKKTVDEQKNKAVSSSLPEIEDASGKMQNVLDDVDPKATNTARRSEGTGRNLTDEQIDEKVDDALDKNVDVPELKENIKDSIRDKINGSGGKSSQHGDRPESTEDQDASGQEVPGGEQGNKSSGKESGSGNSGKSDGALAEKIKKFLDSAHKAIS